MTKGETDVNKAHTSGLDNAQLAAKIQWEPVEFSSLRDVKRASEKLAKELQRLDIASRWLYFVRLNRSDLDSLI